MANTSFVFDFDSTFVQAEAFDLLATTVSKNQTRKNFVADIQRLTELSMDGKYSFHDSLKARMEAVSFKKEDIEIVVQLLKSKISPSFLRNKAFFEKYKDDIYIVSGGFIEFIWPIVKPFGIAYDHIHANRFLFDFDGQVVGFDEQALLAQDQGKVMTVKQMGLKGNVIVVGDGYTDYEIKAANVADSFFAYTETIARPNVIAQADAVIENLEGLFLMCNIPTKSAPKPRKALLLEGIHPFVENHLKALGFTVTCLNKSLSPEELLKEIEGIDLLGIRSKTAITNDVVEKASSLQTIGVFCIGTNHIDLKACQKKGIAVFNAPFSNTRSVVEICMAEIIMLFRRLGEKNIKMHQGLWEKSSEHCYEVRGKTLGIIGYGNIGSQLSILAENFGMKVIYFDLVEKLPLGNAKACVSLEQCLQEADVVSLHVDGRSENKHLIDERALSMMKEGSYIINLSRGFVIDLKALESALNSQHLLGAAIDVFPEEPEGNQAQCQLPFQDKANVILTPHIGGSTKEAQENIGHFVATRLQEYMDLGSTLHCVNMPQLQLPSIQGSHRLLHIHENVPGILAQINSYFAKHKINIEGQYLKTDENVGYVITDIHAMDGEDFMKDLQTIQHTIRVRVLY